MKKTSFLRSLIFLAALFITSCKDDPELSLPKDVVLSKVFRDGKMQFEYRYTQNKQVAQIREFDLTTGLLDYFSEFEYDSRGILKDEITYNANEIPVSRKTYLKNSNGQLVSSEFIPLTGSDSGLVTIRHRYEYNKEGHISKESWHNPESDKEEAFAKYFYYPNGNLERYEYYWTAAPTPEKTFEARYSPAGTALPENIRKHSGYPVNLMLYYFVAEHIEHELFDSGLAQAGEYHEIISDRRYNSHGLVTGQTTTYKYIQPEAADETTTNAFEYMEL